MVKTLNKIVNGASMLGSSALALYGGKLQSLASSDIINYEPYMGQLSDFSSACAFSSFFLLIPSIFEDKSPVRYIPTFGVSAVLSFMELLGAGGKPDPNDITAYFAGGSLAVLIDYFTRKVGKVKPQSSF